MMITRFFCRAGIAAAVLLCLISNSLSAQRKYPSTPGEILLGLHKLNTLGSVLYIAAHPDDENTRLLAWLANEKKVRTGYLSLTRGDGGQNLIGPEQGEALGLIRTQELLAARRIDGAEQFFTRAYDFGFSKNPEETFRIWNKDSVLEDMVYIIRVFRPDIIITRFPTTGEGGHGHHTASALLALEAFDAAADPSRFSWLDVPAWKTRRLFWNTFNFGGANTTSPDQLQINVGGYNPLLGKSYGEIAAESRSMHKSQGFGSARQRGPAIEYFKQLKGDKAAKDLFEGIDLTWGRLPKDMNRSAAVDDIIRHYDPVHPERSIPALRNLIPDYMARRHEPDSSRIWRFRKHQEAEDLAIACSGVWIEALASRPSDAIHSKYEFAVQAISRTPGGVRIGETIWFGDSEQPVRYLKEPVEVDTNRVVYDMRGGGAYLSHPYWLSRPRSKGLYPRNYQNDLLRPEGSENNSDMTLRVQVGGEEYYVQRPVVYKSVDPVKGEVYRPFEILPPATVHLAEKAFVFDGTKPRTIKLVIQNHGDSVKGRLELAMSPGWKASTTGSDFSIRGRDEELTVEATITPVGTPAPGTMRAELIVNGWRYSYSLRRIQYDHIPAQVYLPPAEAQLISVHLKKAGTAIGYIPGAGDGIPAALRQIGYTVTELDEAAVAAADLSKYNAIVTGVRAYNTTEWLQAHYSKLMDYVKGGGNLVVQYNTNNRIGPVKARIAPDTFTITRDRVTDEDAEVRFVAPLHPVLNVPNKIGPEDFKGWIQERGIYFASGWSPKYETVLSMNDPDEKPNEGSLIIEKYGKGNFVYTGLVFFRQLPAGNPGAYRLFVNLLSLPRNQ